MELRRALLLFAIVLGVAAVVAALAGPSTRDDDRAATPPPTDPEARANAPARVRLSAADAPVRRTLRPDRATTLVVEVDEPGQVTVPSLGLTDDAEPRDPAIFETLPRAGQRYRVLFTPAGDTRPRELGQLTSRPAN